jgi:hypothetical protein
MYDEIKANIPRYREEMDGLVIEIARKILVQKD